MEISRERYIELLKAETKLEMLENSGVDNWDWYGDALNPDGEMSYRELCDEIEKTVPQEQRPMTSLIFLLWACGWVIGVSMEAIDAKIVTLSTFIGCWFAWFLALLLWPLWLYKSYEFDKIILWKTKP
jgi:hypothetical protein